MTTENIWDGSPDIEALKTHIAAVDAADTMAEAGRKILLGEFVKMLQNEAGSRAGDDIEHVHDMRVATRRMRSAFRLLEAYYKPKPTRPYIDTLKLVANHLGAVRDLDVLIENLESHRAGLDAAGQEALGVVIAGLDKKRRKSRKKLVAFLDSATYQAFVTAFAEFLVKPGKAARPIDQDSADPYQVRHVLPSIIHDHLAHVRAYDNVMDNPGEDTLHALRIEFKRLRYAVDYFEDVLGASGTDFIKELKHIQDYLGRLNDLVVAEEYLESVLDDGLLSEDQAAVLQASMQGMDAERAALRAGFPDVWASFNKRSVQRKLSDALLVLR